MNLKRFLTVALACLLSLSLVACNPDDTVVNVDTDTDKGASVTDALTDDTAATETQKTVVTKTYNATEILENSKILGRTSVEADGLAFDHSSAGLEFNAYVEGAITVEITVAKGKEDSNNDDCYFTLFIDGVRREERVKAVKNTKTTTVLATFEEGGVHNVRLVRQTEARNALAAVTSLTFTGYFENKPANAPYYIEFMGASNTAGYGNLTSAKEATVAQLAENQDSTQSYTYLTAEKLGADYSMLSVSGIGAVKGYRQYPLKAVFDANSYFRNKSVVYTPVRTPDLVVIAVGSNDESKGTTQAEYRQGIIDLITGVRMTYGDIVPIVWVYYTENMTYRATAKEAIAVCGGEGALIYDVEVLFNKLGGNNHPDLQSHRDGAEKLTQFIKDINVLG